MEAMDGISMSCIHWFLPNHGCVSSVSVFSGLTQPLFPESRKHLFHNIVFQMGGKPGTRIGDLVVGVPGIKHAEPIMVFGGKNHIFHSRFPGRLCPMLRVEFFRIKGLPDILVRFLVHIVYSFFVGLQLQSCLE